MISVSGIPVSSSKIFHFSTSDSRLAITEPADPEPTMIKSYSLPKIQHSFNARKCIDFSNWYTQMLSRRQ